MYYPILDNAKYVHPLFSLDETLIVEVLKNSHGKPTMSDEDVKLAILSLFSTCKRQQNIIEELGEVVSELRAPKKKFWQRRK